MMKHTEQDLKEIKERLRVEKLHSGSQKMYDTLKWLDRRGGLGLDEHDKIRQALRGATLDY